MDFHQLLAKMQELDQPVPEAQVIEGPNEGNEFSGALAAAKAAGKDEFEVDGKKYKVKEDGSVEECGMSSPSMPSRSETPPNMSINLNAQGLEDIADLMQLMTKVNPDMQKPSMPSSIGIEPMDTVMDKPMGLPPLKMLPDMDADNDNKPGGEKDMDQPGKLGASLDRDGDGDHDMKDHDLEKKEKEEEFANEPDVEIKSIDYMNNKLAGGMNRPKSTFPKVADGDNPMQKKQFESGDLKSQIRAELQRRLAEAKGAK